MAILTLFRHRFYKNDGTLNSGGKVYTYVAGTTTPTETYTDSSGSVANTNPIILDAKGEADIWVVGQIKVNVLESDDTQVTGWPVDNIGSGVSNNDATARWAGTATGSANALAISPSPAISAYVVGQSFIFKAGASNNTGVTTIATSGLTPIAAQSNGAAMSGGEILANNFYIGVLDTLTTCQISKIGEPTLAELGAAALAGSASQVFSVGTATAAAHAMNMNAVQKQTGVYFGTGGTSTAYTCSATGVTAYSDGLTLDIQPHVTCGNAATINVNAIGAVSIYRELVAGTIVAIASGEMAQYVNQRITYSTPYSGFIIRGSKARRTKLISATRDMTAASGAVAYTGVGFKPTKITAYSAISSTRMKSTGSGSVGNCACAYSGSTSGYDAVTSKLILQASTTAGASQDFNPTAMGDDGFTGDWTKTGTPAAETATIRFFCEE